jgi:uncharacterized protein YecE (DUF72 family)
VIEPALAFDQRQVTVIIVSLNEAFYPPHAVEFVRDWAKEAQKSFNTDVYANKSH